jgi:hypothetical protein
VSYGTTQHRDAVVKWRSLGPSTVVEVLAQLEAEALAPGTSDRKREALAAAAGLLRATRAGQP